MSLNPGTRLGRYEVRSKIGEGGMGEVYLAEDTELERPVALKLLPAEVASDEQRMRRFVQEAKAASALNHPNILTVYEIGERDGARFISTEYVRGETLRQRLSRERLTLRECFDLALQIAAALAAAHEAGVVHRDVKPENVMLRPDGLAKVLDFGLAKLTERSRLNLMPDAEAPTRALVNTAPGVVMGTAAYMSPEQARGLETDERTDIWSFGVVLYEMLTGRSPFAGETASDIIAAILKGEPAPLAQAAPEAPAELQRIVRKALQKHRDERYQTIKDLLLDLKSLKRELEFADEIGRSTTPSSGAGTFATMGGAPHALPTASKMTAGATSGVAAHSTSSAEYIVTEIKRHKRAALGALAALVALVAAFGAYRYFTGRQTAGHFSAGRKLNVKRLTSSGKVNDAAISPDGRYVAYVAQVGDKQSVRLLQVNTSSDVEIVAPVEPPLWKLSFSRDGEYLYYVHRAGNIGTLYQIAALGGTPRQIRYDIDSGAAVSPDGKTLAFVHEDHQADETLTEMLLANADGSNVRRVAAHKSHEAFFYENYTPAWSSDGKMIACGISYGKENEQHLKLVSLRVADGAEQPLTDREWDYIGGVAWLDDGNLIVSGILKTGAPEEHSQLWLVRAGVAPEALTTELLGYYGVSVTPDGGALVTTQDQYSQALWIAPNNDAARAVRAVQETATFNHPSWTPDGRLLYQSTAGGNQNIWVVNADGANKKQLTSQCRCVDPQMSADGRYIIYTLYNADWQSHIWRMDSDGGNQKQLTGGDGEDWPTFSRDGKWVIYSQQGGNDTKTLWKVPLDGGAPARLTTTDAYAPTVSPLDGSIAYVFLDKRDNYARKISVIPPEGGAPLRTFAFPKEGDKYGIIRFTPDGRALAFVGKRDNGANIWTIPADGSGEAKPLTDFKTESIFRFFAWSADGKRLALIRGTDASDAVLLSDEK